jgi:phospholipid/cholesterol/gamma-HCH transport system permease protein
MADDGGVRRWGGLAVGVLTYPLAWLGSRGSLLSQALSGAFGRPWRGRLIIREMQFIGVASLPLIVMVGLFSGGVAAESTLAALKAFRQETNVGGLVGVSMAMELAPVFTGLMLAARGGAGMAAELGSMRISEQVDALVTFNIDPVQYLVTPRIVASLIMSPIMTMVFNIVGLGGAYFVAVKLNNIDPGAVLASFHYYTDPTDYLQGTIKAVVFGVSFSVLACHEGLGVRGGAREVGKATTNAVVAGAASILVLDYFLTDALLLIWPPIPH